MERQVRAWIAVLVMAVGAMGPMAVSADEGAKAAQEVEEAAQEVRDAARQGIHRAVQAGAEATVEEAVQVGREVVADEEDDEVLAWVRSPLESAMTQARARVAWSLEETYPLWRTLEEDAEIDVGETPQQARQLARYVRDQVEVFDERFNLMVLGNIDGQLAEADCRLDREERRYFWARQVAYRQALEAFAEGHGRRAPLALNVGNMLFPGPLGRYLLNEAQEHQELAQMLAALDSETMGLGNREFAVPRQPLTRVLEKLNDGGPSVQAANLRCPDFAGSEGLCRVVQSADDDRPYEVIDRGHLTVGVTTVLATQLLARLQEEQRQGVEISSPRSVLDELVGEMREEVDLVIVQYIVPSGQGTELAYDLASRIEGIDLMVSSHLVQQPEDEISVDWDQPVVGGRSAVIEAIGTGTPIVSANSTAQGVVNVELDLYGERVGNQTSFHIRSVVPRRASTERIPGDEATQAMLDEAVERYCEDWGDPVGDKAELKEPLSAAEFQRLVLDVMRFETRSEVAISNLGAFRNEAKFPLEGALTRADIHSTLPYDNRAVVVEVQGSVLRRIGGRLGMDAVAQGLEIRDGQWKVNGRSLNNNRRYRVAVNEFVADGGDGLLASGDVERRELFHPEWSVEAPTISEMVIHYFEEEKHIRPGVDGIEAGANFVDLHEKFLWRFNSSLNASYNQVMVRNPERDGAGAYDQSQLGVQSTDQINLEGRFMVEADSRNHGWTNDLNLQFATARITDDEEVSFERTKDQIRLRSRYRYQRLRASQAGRWFVPDPVMEGQLESEFRRAPTRDWHRLDLRVIGGASFQIRDELDVRLGANVRSDINEPGGEPTLGLNLSYTLGQVAPVRIFDRPVRLESEVEYFYNDIGRQNIHETRSANRVYFAVSEQLFFTTTFNAFLYRDDVVGELGSNTELTIGVNYRWDGARQNFR